MKAFQIMYREGWRKQSKTARSERGIPGSAVIHPSLPELIEAHAAIQMAWRYSYEKARTITWGIPGRVVRGPICGMPQDAARDAGAVFRGSEDRHTDAP